MISGQLEIPYNQFSEHDEAKLKELSLLVNGDMIEVGCWTGHSTSILAQRAKDINKTVVVVDNFKGNEGTPLQEFAESNSVYNIFVNNMRELGLYHNVQVMYTDSNNAHSNTKPTKQKQIDINFTNLLLLVVIVILLRSRAIFNSSR